MRRPRTPPDLARVDAALRGLGARRRREPDWDALAARIDARLDEELEALDAEAPPRFEDEARTREPAVSQEVPAMRAAPPAAAPGGPERAPAPVVELASRRSGVVVWLGGLAAAAAVGLGITFGVTTLGAPAEELAAAPAMQEAAPSAVPAPAEAAWEGEAMAEMPAAEPEPLPAAAALMPGAPPPAAPPAPEPVAAAPAPRAQAAPAPDLMDRVGSGGSARGGAAPRPDEPATPPSRAAILSALASVEPDVQRCLSERGQVAHVTMQVGAHGRVMSVRVSPPYAGGEATCIVNALHAAQLPASPTDYPIAHAFRPAPMAGGSLARPPAAARRQRPATAPSRQASEISDAFSR
ncbi:MAG: hypothetical protein M5U28_31880 [Sandaracinaceae bacterium]|nr:hypothetical protein [Sandaracinaceae bacterium]